MQCIGNASITLIQGDTYSREIEIKNVDLELIEGIYFSCEKLGVCKKLNFNSEEKIFELKLTSLETQSFPKINTNFDLTIVFIDNTVKTIQHCESLVVIEKRNKVDCL
jgi:hypothetical protein